MIKKRYFLYLIFFALFFTGCFDYSITAKDNSAKNVEKIDKLISSGKINDRDRQGFTLLYWAIFWNNESLVDKLLKNGADTNLEFRNSTIWDIALNVKFVQRRESEDINSSIRDKRVEFANLSIIKLLVEKGKLDLNKKLKDSNTPLFLASFSSLLNGDFRIVDFLIQNSAIKNIRNDKNQTIIQYSIANLNELNKSNIYNIDLNDTKNRIKELENRL